MANLKVIVGLLFMTLTILLSTRPAEAADCSGDKCKNSGTCPADNQTPCECTEASGKKGDFCDDDCLDDSECLNGGTCSETSPKTCSCGDYKGTLCADECEDNDDCGTDGTCSDASPKKCTCKDTSKTGPGCTKSKSGASAVASFSLMSLFVILTGFLL